MDLEILLIPLILGFLLSVLMTAAGWLMFTKAGEPGWASLVPIYNAFVFLKICGKPWWWIILLGVPFVAQFLTAKRFGKEIGYALGLFFLPFIFYPMLAFGDATYEVPEPPQRGRSKRSVTRYDDDEDDEDDWPRKGSKGRDEDDRPRRRRDEDDEDEDVRPRRR